MTNGKNVLFGRVAVDLQLVADAEVHPVLQDHLDRPEDEFAQALVQADLLSEIDSARVRAVVARLLERHQGDAARALAELEAGSDGNAPEPDQMVTLAAAPAAWRTLSESTNLVPEDVSERYVDPVEHDRGGMGRILIVRDERMNRTIAMKELAPALRTDDATLAGETPRRISAFEVQRFLREARITGSLEHPSIVPVYEVGRRADGSHYYTMKLVRGRSLFHAIHECKALRERLKLLPHVIDLCQAIAYAHDKGIIHRDIKPSNVMVGAFGETVVIDWGLARVMDQEDPFAADLGTFTETQLAGRPEDPRLTTAGLPVGTPHYMAPEQAEGRMSEVGPRSDVYALGVVLYEVLTGTTPFTGTTSRVVLQKVRVGQPPSVHAHEPGIPPELAAICARAMARQPNQRYPSAAELADDLTRFTTGALVKGYEYTTGELVRHYYRKNRALCNSAIAATAVILVVAIAAYVNILNANHRERLQRLAADAARTEAEGSAYRANIQLAANHVDLQAFDQATALLLEQPPALRNLEWGLLFEQCNQDHTTNGDQEADVDRIWTAPGGRLLSLSIQDELVVRACPDLAPLHRFPLNLVVGATVALSTDGAWLAVGRVDGLLQLYNFQNYSPVHEFSRPGISFDSVAFSGDGALLASGTSDGKLLLWNCSTGELTREIDAHDAACQVFGVSRNGDLAITSDRSGRTVVWDIANGQIEREFIGYGPSLSRNLDRFALRSGHVVQVHELESGKRLFESPELQGEPLQPVLSPSGLLVAAIVDDGVMRLWDVESGRPVATVQDDNVTRILAFSPDSELIALAANPHEIRIFRTKDGLQIAALQGHSKWIRAGAFSDDGRMFYSCAGEAAIKAWQIPPANSPAAAGTTPRIAALVAASDAPVIAAASPNGIVHFLDAETFQPSLTVAAYDATQYTPIDINAKGDEAVAALGIKTAQILSLPDGEIVSQWNGSPGRIRALAYCQNGRTVATLGGGNSVYLWDRASGRDVLRLDGHTDKVMALAVLPSGDRIVTGDLAGRILLWDVATGTIKQELRAGGAAVTALACSPDGLSVAAAYANEGAELHTITFPPRTIRLSVSGVQFSTLSYSPDGMRLLGLTKLDGYKLWDTRTGQQMAVRTQPKWDFTASLLLDSARDRILAGDSKSSVQVTPVFPKSLYNARSIEPETLASYKRSRVQAAWPQPILSRFVVALTPTAVVEEALGRLDQLGEVRPGELYTEPGANPLARLGLIPGDSVTKLDGAPCPDRQRFSAGLESFAHRPESAPASLRIALARDGAEVTIEHRRVSVVSTRKVVEVTRAQARAALANTQALLLSQQKFLTDYSRKLDNGQGAGLDGPDALDGIWLPPTSTGKEDLDLAALGLGEQDHIMAINGDAVTSYAQLVDVVARALIAVETGFTGEVRLRVTRDRFQILDLTWSVV